VTLNDNDLPDFSKELDEKVNVYLIVKLCMSTIEALNVSTIEC